MAAHDRGRLYHRGVAFLAALFYGTLFFHTRQIGLLPPVLINCVGGYLVWRTLRRSFRFWFGWRKVCWLTQQFYAAGNAQRYSLAEALNDQIEATFDDMIHFAERYRQIPFLKDRPPKGLDEP
jgi:hypothetical protein